MTTKFGIFLVFMSPKEIPTQQNVSPLTTILILHVTLILFLPAKGISVEQCCRRLEVPEICVRTLCNPGLPPSDFAVYDIFERRNNCSKHLNPIAKCLAAGRDNFSCCSMEAKDSDVNSCFGLCRGDADIPPSNSYQTCIAINLGTMFACLILETMKQKMRDFEKGYRKSPSQPKNLIIEDLGATELVLSWEEPEFNAPLVDHYLLLIYELETGSKLPDLETELRVETVNRNARITLEPGTRYLVQVIALGISNENNVNSIEELNYPRSLPTEIRFKTLGIAPQVTPFKDTVRAALNSNTVIACRIRISGGSTRVDPEIRWEHKHIGHFHSIRTSDRFIPAHYNFSRFRPREILATLEIKAIKPHDQGYYKCKVSDDFGHSEATVNLLLVSRYEPQAIPPKTPLECCKDLGVEQRCLSMCGPNEVEQKMKYIPRPFMNQNCSGEISKVLSCAMPNVDESACCISNKVPAQCLYLCDNHIKPSNLMPINCLGHVHIVEKCRLKGLQYRPGFVANLKINKTLDNLISINFDSSERADIHFIYWRFQNGNWQQKSLNNSSTKLYPPVDEIVILATNPFGYSPPSRIKLFEGNWIRI